MGTPLIEKNSARSYRWVRIWLGVGVLLALLLLANSLRDYFFVARILSTQQLRHQVTQRVAAFERDLREARKPETSRLKLLMDEMAAGSQQPLWVVLRDPDGHVLEQAGTPERQVFTHDQEISHFRNRESLFAVIPSRQGEAVVEVFPVYAGSPNPSTPSAGIGNGRGPFVIATEVAMPLSAADPATLWPIRRNLMINVTSALGLLLTVGLTAWGFSSYVRGKQLEQQVEIARQVQANLLPRIADLGGGVQVVAAYQPAEEVAGDFYDAFHTSGELALVIGDVSGKGIPAALLMGVIHGAVRSGMWTESRARHEHETAELNRLLCERTSGERFASMFWSYCDVGNTLVRYVNAGHCAPMLISPRNGKVEITRLDVGGPVLGLLPEVTYTQGCAEIQPGDVLVLYSDGLLEATNAEGEEFGESRLQALLSQSPTASPEEIRNSILSTVRAFLGEVAVQDDLTCVVTKFG
ncbi:MAG TPA: PP2C family protein-serine/threonine phosphatase [Candidatus Sulfotelmatobacter sp.]|nr:PP2C family protein-serine/threonine phosphatase [Candidatus Sulfotelmatobacter sp.]